MWEQHEVELERKIAKLEAQQKDFYEAAKKVSDGVFIYNLLIFTYACHAVWKEMMTLFIFVNTVANFKKKPQN